MPSCSRKAKKHTSYHHAAKIKMRKISVWAYTTLCDVQCRD